MYTLMTSVTGLTPPRPKRTCNLEAMAERRDPEGEAAEEGRLEEGDAEPAETYDEMYAEDGYVESGVAEPGTMQEVDMSGESDLEQEEEREEYHDEAGEPAEGVEGALNPPLTQRQAPDADDAIDRGFLEDREFERDEEEGRGPTNAATRDPLEES